MVFSDGLDPDEAVDIAKVAGLKLFVRDAAGKDEAVEHKVEKHSLAAKLPGSGPRVVFGSVAYGVMQKGDAKPFLLAYHPKAVIGSVAAKSLVIGEKLPAEIVPAVEAGKVRFQLLGSGKPVAGAEVTVLKPDATTAKLKTGDGWLDRSRGRERAVRRLDPLLRAEGRRARRQEVRRGPPLRHARRRRSVRALPLPTAVSSFGAIACDGYLYVYGGHAGKTHSYDTKSVLGTFHRLKLDGGTQWEELPGGPILRG